MARKSSMGSDDTKYFALDAELIRLLRENPAISLDRVYDEQTTEQWTADKVGLHILRSRIAKLREQGKIPEKPAGPVKAPKKWTDEEEDSLVEAFTTNRTREGDITEEEIMEVARALDRPSRGVKHKLSLLQDAVSFVSGKPMPKLVLRQMTRFPGDAKNKKNKAASSSSSIGHHSARSSLRPREPANDREGEEYVAHIRAEAEDANSDDSSYAPSPTGQIFSGSAAETAKAGRDGAISSLPTRTDDVPLGSSSTGSDNMSEPDVSDKKPSKLVITKPAQILVRWTQREDDTLKNFLRTHGEGKVITQAQKEMLASELPGRTVPAVASRLRVIRTQIAKSDSPTSSDNVEVDDASESSDISLSQQSEGENPKPWSSSEDFTILNYIEDWSFDGPPREEDWLMLMDLLPKRSRSAIQARYRLARNGKLFPGMSWEGQTVGLRNQNTAAADEGDSDDEINELIVADETREMVEAAETLLMLRYGRPEGEQQAQVEALLKAVEKASEDEDVEMQL